VSLQFRTFLAFVALAAGFVLALTYSTLRDIRPQPLQATEDALVETANVLAAFLEREADARGVVSTEFREAMRSALARPLQARIYEHTKREMTLRVYVTDARGVVVYDSAGEAEGRDFSHWQDVARTLRGEYGARATRSHPGDALSSVHYVAAPIHAGGRLAGVVSVGKPVLGIKAFIQRTERRVTSAAAAAVLAAALASLALATWITVPLRRLERHAREIAAGRRPAAPRLAAPEVAALGRAFEAMRDALEGKRYVEGYVRSLTHEIKSPLSAIRASAELLDEDMSLEDRRRFLANIRAETERLQRLVDRMLELSTLEARKGLERAERLDLAALVADVRRSAEPLARQKGLVLEVGSLGVPAIHGDGLLLRQALSNLVANAIQATPAGGTVRLDAASDGECVRLIVVDSGPGVPEYALPRVFERFYSVPVGDGATAGTGLGLPFVREVALLHGGDASLVNVPGGGARAEIRLRLAPLPV
jgi:two-component system, OmpR family, sensor histidine kinase CreC